MAKIIDLRLIAAQMNVGEFQLYAQRLDNEFLEDQLDFMACPGAVMEFTCKDGPHRTLSYIVENNTQYQTWHQNVVAEIRKQLSFKREKLATTEEYADFTPEQLRAIAMKAREQMKRAATASARPRQRRQDTPASETPETTGATPQTARTTPLRTEEAPEEALSVS